MLEIKPYVPAFWQGIEKVHDAARMQELTLAGLEDAFLPLSIAAEREDLFGYTVCVAVLEETAVGFVAFTEDELAWLYVSPEHQRQGIGRKLASYALEQMGQGVKTVEVLQGNTPAQQLYRSLSFTKEQLIHGWMPGNESFAVTVWQMTKE